MKRLTRNVLVDTERRGSNHGLVTTSDGLVLIDGPHKPSDTLRLKAEIERCGQLRYIINTEPHGDHWTSNAYFDVPVVAHEGVRKRIFETNMGEMLARVATFGPEEPKLCLRLQRGCGVRGWGLMAWERGRGEGARGRGGRGCCLRSETDREHALLCRRSHGSHR